MSHASIVVPSRTAEVIVLGAGYAGMLAAIRLAGRAGREARVTLVNDRPHFVERIRLHQLAAGQALDRRQLARMLRSTGVELVVAKAISIDASARKVALEGGVVLSYDYLVYALGSGAPKSGIAGADEHAHAIGTEEGAVRLASAVGRLGRGGSVAVIGGGLTAIEAASEIAEARPDLAVSMYTDAAIGASLSAGGSGYVRRSLAEIGVEVNEGARVDAVTRSGVTLASGRCLRADVVVDCSGLRSPGVASRWGLPSTSSGRLSIDACLRSISNERVFGAGDGAAIATDEAAFIRMACASAMPLGAHAADNVLCAIRGERLTPFGFGFFAQCVSVGRRRGLLQHVDPDDTPSERFVGGWLGARLKEAVCRYTTASLAIERLLPGTYTWPRKNAPLSLGAPRDLLDPIRPS